MYPNYGLTKSNTFCVFFLNDIDGINELSLYGQPYPNSRDNIDRRIN